MDKILLKTYRINAAPDNHRDIVHFLYDKVLNIDRYWHFFRDEGGITLRFSPAFEKKVVEHLKEEKRNYQVAGDYDPSLNEYEGVRFIGSDWLPLFNALSVLSTKYPQNVTMNQVLERMNHAIVNQSGIHNFYREAEIYCKLALGRAELGALSGRGSK